MTDDTTPAVSTGRTAAAAVALRLAGASYAEVAEALGYLSDAEARAAVENDLAKRAADADPAKRELLRAEHAGRIDRLLRGLWGKATNAQDPEHLPAVRVALTLIDRRIRLYGLDAPVEILVHNPTAREIDEWVAAVTGNTVVVGVVEHDPIAIGPVLDAPAAG